MKREILFRGKRIDNGDFVDGDLMQHYIHHKGLTIVQGGCINYEVDQVTVGQFTGLKDKNGAKIFEGDIVAFQRTRNFEKEYVLPKEMKWEDRAKDGGVSGWTQFYPLNQFVVIGNIHDNPELL